MSKLNDTLIHDAHETRIHWRFGMLAGKTVLIVETEALIAIDIQSALETLGVAEVIVAFGSAEAQRLAGQWRTASLAIIEVEMDRPDLIALIHEVTRSGIPTIAITADTRLVAGLVDLPQVQVLAKPIPEATLLAALHQARTSQG